MAYDMKKTKKHGRILAMYAALLRGEYISKNKEAERYGVDVRTVQRDIDAIREYLDMERECLGQKAMIIVYDRRKKAYVLEESNIL